MLASERDDLNADQCQASSSNAADEVNDTVVMEKNGAPSATPYINADGQNVIDLLSDTESDGISPVKNMPSRENTDPIDKYEPMDIDAILDGIQNESASEQETDEPMHVIDELLGDCTAMSVDNAIAEQIDGEYGHYGGTRMFHVNHILIKPLIFPFVLLRFVR